MDTADLRARVDRLHKLVMGLMHEDDVAREELPLYVTERPADREAISQAIGGLEVVRRVLVEVLHRMKGTGRYVSSATLLPGPRRRRACRCSSQHR
jgi:hypothetical protein